MRPDPGTSRAATRGESARQDARDGGRDSRRAEIARIPGITPPDVTVLITVTERPSSLVEMHEEVLRLLTAAGYSVEFIILAHPDTAALTSPLQRFEESEELRILVTGRRLGETGLLRIGRDAARGRIILTLPAYRQVELKGIAELVQHVDSGAHLAAAYRSPREDPAFNKIQSRIFHRVVNMLTGRRLKDLGCGVRAIRREVMGDLPLYGDFSRFLPVLAMDRGYRVVEVPLAQDSRDRGARVYGPGIYLRRVLDLLGLYFLMRFTDKPLRFFGLIGSLLGGVGGVIMLVLFIQRLNQQGISERPLLLLAVLFVVLGVQSVALGLIGEIIVHLGATGRRVYRVREDADG